MRRLQYFVLRCQRLIGLDRATREPQPLGSRLHLQSLGGQQGSIRLGFVFQSQALRAPWNIVQGGIVRPNHSLYPLDMYPLGLWYL